MTYAVCQLSYKSEPEMVCHNPYHQVRDRPLELGSDLLAESMFHRHYQSYGQALMSSGFSRSTSSDFRLRISGATTNMSRTSVEL